MGAGRGGGGTVAGRGGGGIAVTLALALWFLPTCSPAPESGRGFGSRQLLKVRDPLLALRAFSQDQSRIYLARFLSEPNPLTGDPPYNRSILDLGTGDDRPIQEAVIYANLLVAAPGVEAALALVHYASAAEAPAVAGFNGGAGPHPLLSLIDEVTGERLKIPDVADLPRLGATRAHPMAVDRIDPAGGRQTWLGPPDDLRRVGNLEVLGLDEAGVFARPSGPGQISKPRVVYQAADGSAPVEVVPFRLGQHLAVAGDADPLPPWVDATLAQNVRYLCPAPVAGAPSRCFLLFARDLASELRSWFVRFLDDPVERALPGPQQTSPLLITMPGPPVASPGEGALIWLAVDIATGARLYSWPVGADRAAGCAVGEAALDRIAWNRAEDQYAALTSTTVHTARNVVHTWTLYTGRVGGACQAAASGSKVVKQLVLSPDGATVFRLEVENATDGTATIVASAFDGGEDRTIASGVFEHISFLDDRRLQVVRISPDGLGLSWLDPLVTPVVEHPFAERVPDLFSVAWLNDRWLVAGHSYSAQDDSFTLSAIDTETGRRRDISSAVTTFRLPWTRPGPNTTEAPVVYVVRGRIASAQDGVWYARLPLADFTSQGP